MKGKLLITMLLVLLSACDTTRHIPEDDTLYRGIKRVTYGVNARQSDEDDKGVITALADAYNTVEGLLSGDGSVLAPEMTEKELRDSIHKANQQDKETFKAVQEEVDAVLAYAPNGALMGSSFVTHPFPVKLWLYNRYAGSKHKFGQYIFNHFAGSPVLMSNVNPRMRSTVAQNTLRNHGYFRARVSYTTLPLENPRKEKVSYNVQQGPLYHLDSISYLHFPTAADTIIRQTAKASLIGRGKPFSAPNLDGERQRLNKAFRNAGFYYHLPEHISYKADTTQTPMMVKLHVQPSASTPDVAMRPFHLGTTRVNIYKYNDMKVTDSLSRRDISFYFSGGEKKPPLHPASLRRSILFRRGDLYQQDVHDAVIEKLAAMNIFSSMRLNYVPRDTSALCDTLDVVLTAMLDKPYDAEFQGKVMGKMNGQVGPGASFSVSKRNAFRHAELLSLQLWASYEWQTGANVEGKRSLLNSYEYGMTGSLSYPRIKIFGLGRKLGRTFTTSTNNSINARWMNRAGYFGRVSFGIGQTYTLEKGNNIKHEFSPITLTYDQLLNSTARFDSIVTANQTLAVSMRDQFIPSMEYNLTWVGTPANPSKLNVGIKEASAIVSSIYAIAGRSYQEKDKSLFNVPFAQFIRLTAQYTKQWKLSKRSELAMRAFGGMVYSYGNAMAAPYSELFSIGGANSLRAFTMRSIGPGAYHPASSGFSYIDQTGDIKLEANLEYRFPLVGNLSGAAFIDAGNVWLMRQSETQPDGQFDISRFGKDIALGTGAGLRYDLGFLVLRLDLGIGIHAPYDTGRSGYYNMASFGKSLGYHFAIGMPF